MSAHQRQYPSHQSSSTPASDSDSSAQQARSRPGVSNAQRQAALQMRPGPIPDVLSQAFGADFSGVEVVQDGRAARLGANALADGDRIHVKPGQQPGTPGYTEMMGEELAHLVQQSTGRVSSASGVVAEPRLESEARSEGRRVSQGLPARRQAAGQRPRPIGAAQPSSEITADQIAAAQTWAQTADLGREAVESLQRALGVAVSGTYDDTTIRAVYGQQRQWQASGTILNPGQARAVVFQRLGLILTNTIQDATVGAGMLGQLQADCPDGVTVAIVPSFQSSVSGRSEFARQATAFASNQAAVGLSGGQIALGVPVNITDIGDAIEAVQSISRGLQAAWRAANPTGGDPPAFTRVKNLALFSHGESWGMGLNASNDFSAGGLHNTTRGNNPANVEAFVQGLQGALAGDVRVQLFACSSGADEDRSSYEEWTRHPQGEREGENSLGASMATALGPDASVYAHTTVGHTTENYAARVFGAESGGGQGGLVLFDVMYPESFLQSELARLYPALDEAGRTSHHDPLREQMWAHFKDSVLGEHQRAASAKRYPLPMGQECFTNPDNARTLLYADWTTWITTRLPR